MLDNVFTNLQKAIVPVACQYTIINLLLFLCKTESHSKQLQLLFRILFIYSNSRKFNLPLSYSIPCLSISGTESHFCQWSQHEVMFFMTSSSLHRGFALIPIRCRWLAKQSYSSIRRSSATVTHLGESGTLFMEFYHSFPDVLNDGGMH